LIVSGTSPLTIFWTALDDGGLTDARLPDEDGCSWCGGKDLHDPLDLPLPADDGVELALRASCVRLRPN